MSPVSILIVEEDASIARELAEHLEGLGYRIAGNARSSQEALQMIEQFQPGIVLTNVRIKGKLEGIRTGSLVHRLHDLPVIYVIDQGSQATIRRAAATSPFGYIFRPFDQKQVLATIETALIRHQLERKLEQSRQWLNTTLTSIADGVLATDEQGRIRFMNPAAMRLTGWSREDAMMKPFYQVFSLVDESSHELVDLASAQDNLLRGERSGGLEGILLAKTGRLIVVEARITPIKDGKGSVFGMVLVFRDVTQQREAALEIKRQANRAEALVQVASQLNAQIELEKVLLIICEITNRTIKAKGTALFLRDDKKDIFQSVATFSEDLPLLASGKYLYEIPEGILESLLSRKNPVIAIPDARVFPELLQSNFFEAHQINSAAIAALFEGDDLLGALISLFTMKEHFLPEEELSFLGGLADQASSAIKNARLFEQVRAGRERQRNLAKSLVDIQEAERRHIARELHDHLGQSLTGLQFLLETTKIHTNDEPKEQIGEIQKLVGDIIGQVREMSLNLRPSMLDDMGLLPTLNWHFERYTSQTKIRVIFKSDEFETRLPAEIETTAYRIIQEALTNVARYAQVKEVFVGLALQNGTLWVEVLDKGRGFDPAAIKDNPTSGLGGMRERADLAGGYLAINSYPNQGTHIFAALPLSGTPLERRKYDRNHPSRG